MNQISLSFLQFQKQLIQ